MVQLGPEYDLAVRLAALEARLAALESNGLAQALSMTQSDGSVGMALGQDEATGSGRWIFYQGVTTSRDPETGLHPTLMYVGELYSSGTPVDSGMIMYRPDGSQSMTVGAGGAGFLDKGRRTVVSTDETSGEGLARPHIPLPTPQATDSSKWITTTAAGWTEIAASVAEMQQPKIRWDGEATGTGDVQLLVKDFSSGATLASSSVWSPGGGPFAWPDTFSLPAGLFGQKVVLSVQARATGGTSVSYVTRALYGVQS